MSLLTSIARRGEMKICFAALLFDLLFFSHLRTGRKTQPAEASGNITENE